MGRPLMVTAMLAVLVSGQGAPPIPEGLWQSKDQGFVIRIEACGAGFCGFAAGAPKDGKKKSKPEEICGKQMLRGFLWNQKSNRWEGTMQPPDSSIKMNSSVTSDGKSFLTLKGKMLFLSKTMSFAPYTGRIRDGCRME